MIGLSFANRVGIQGKGQNKARDRDVILGFPNEAMKKLVVYHLWDRPKIIVLGRQLTFYLDLCPLTLHRRRECNFLTTKLNKKVIAYKWGFPHKPLVDYKGNIVAIKTTLQAKKTGKRSITRLRVAGP